MTTLQPPLLGLEQTIFTTDDYYTPPWLFEQMAIDFDLDVAAPPGGVPWIPATRYYTMLDDGLNSTWEGRVWMNPPYSNHTPWVNRFIEHHDGVALVGFANSKWSNALWNSEAALVELPASMKFVREGMRTDITLLTLLAAFGDECVEAIARVGRVR